MFYFQAEFLNARNFSKVPSGYYSELKRVHARLSETFHFFRKMCSGTTSTLVFFYDWKYLIKAPYVYSSYGIVQNVRRQSVVNGC